MPDRLRLLLAVGALFVAALGTVWPSQLPGRPVDADFVARYGGGELVDEGASPYDVALLIPRTEALGGGARPVFDAPPVMAVFRGLSWLPLRTSSALLEVASLAGCVLIARLLTRGSAWPTWAVASVAMLVFSPAHHTLQQGQIDIVVLAAVLVAARSQPAVTIFKPQTTGLVALALFFGQPRRNMVRPLLLAAAGGLVLLAVTAWLAPSASWFDWWDHLGGRANVRGGTEWQRGVAVLGAVVLVYGLWRNRRSLRLVDEVAVAGATTGLLAVMGGWNPQWFIALCLPLGALVLATVRDEVALRPHHAVLLVAAAGASLGTAFVSRSLYTSDLIVPVASVACLMTGLVLLRQVPVAAGVAVVVVNAVVTYAKLSVADRLALSMLVAVVLLHLVLQLRPARLPLVPAPPG